MTIKQAILSLNYNWLINNEDNDWTRQQLIELYFAHMKREIDFNRAYEKELLNKEKINKLRNK